MREILSEDALDLVDRMYQPGDLLKRSIDDVTAGVVVKFVTRSFYHWADQLTVLVVSMFRAVWRMQSPDNQYQSGRA